MKKIFVVGILWLSVGLSVMGAGEKRAFALQDVYAVKTVSELSVNPDGSKLAFTLSKNDLGKHRSSSNIYLMSPDGKDTLCITSDGKSSGAHWSADGKSVFFTSSASGTEQLYRYSIAERKVEKLTNYRLGISTPVFAPDCKKIVFA